MPLSFFRSSSRITTSNGDPLFGSEDGFSPKGVIHPTFFHFRTGKERVKCYDFLEMIVGRHKALCDKRQRIGRRRRALNERIRKIERESRRLESEPHEWERKGFDIVAIIPSCLRRFLRVLDKLSHLSLATGEGSSFVSCSSEFRRFPMLRTGGNKEAEAKSIDHSSGLLDLSSGEGLSSEAAWDHPLRWNRYRTNTFDQNFP